MRRIVSALADLSSINYIANEFRQAATGSTVKCHANEKLCYLKQEDGQTDSN